MLTVAFTFPRSIFENVVEVPQANAAPKAYSAAMTVPSPVFKFTMPSLKVTKLYPLSML